MFKENDTDFDCKSPLLLPNSTNYTACLSPFTGWATEAHS